MTHCGIGNAGLVALAPALRLHPSLEALCLGGNPIGDEGLVALVGGALPAAAGPPPAAGVLTKLRVKLQTQEIWGIIIRVLGLTTLLVVVAHVAAWMLLLFLRRFASRRVASWIAFLVVEVLVFRYALRYALAVLVPPSSPPPSSPPPSAPPPKGGLMKLKKLSLMSTQITDAGCAVLWTAFDSHALPALEEYGVSRWDYNTVPPRYNTVSISL